VTGSPSSAANFHFIHRNVGSHVQYVSISGGTDINGCWALGGRLKPVVPPELQCRGLGLSVEVFDDHGQSLLDRYGELVCTKPAPCMPLFVWNDDAAHARYRNSYFAKFGPSVWHHGDFAALTVSKGMIIAGRSDATLNPGGVRIGSADISSVVDTIAGISDSLVAGQTWNMDKRIILFVVLDPGLSLSEQLTQTINSQIRLALTPRHVPSKVLQVDEIPYAFNMKKVEIAVKHVLNRQPVTNRGSIQSPESLDRIAELSELWR
jgi:acetoacetyl-CoA synthetase